MPLSLGITKSSVGIPYITTREIELTIDRDEKRNNRLSCRCKWIQSVQSAHSRSPITQHVRVTSTDIHTTNVIEVVRIWAQQFCFYANDITRFDLDWIYQFERVNLSTKIETRG